jgi:nitrite reductase/ring-hydroxylating ferredoxin subunit
MQDDTTIDDTTIQSDLDDTPVVIPVDAYISEDYARAENKRLWGKVWQVACREEEIPKIGDYCTYDILDESVIVVRTALDTIAAYYNVCQHRGRRLMNGCGHTKKFHCRFHGWQWDIEGENLRVVDEEDWGGALNAENLRLPQVKVGRWGGFVFINMDPNCEPLEEFLDPVPHWLDPFELDKMRYRWRQWLYFPCNWKVGIESFNEGYHVNTVHPQLLPWMDSYTWSCARGKHSWFGNKPRVAGEKRRAGAGTVAIKDVADGQDPRQTASEYMQHIWDTLNASVTETIVEASKRLKSELPKDATPLEVMSTMMQIACKMDAERGVIWPSISPEHQAGSGVDWHVFPNLVMLHGATFVLCHRVRPNGYDPNSCIFESFVIERFPEGKEPKAELIHKQEQTEENWRMLLLQDFRNMPDVQRGMKSRGFRGPRPNPKQEQPVINFHKTLAAYMGTGAPKPIKT